MSSSNTRDRERQRETEKETERGRDRKRELEGARSRILEVLLQEYSHLPKRDCATMRRADCVKFVVHFVVAILNKL